MDNQTLRNKIHEQKLDPNLQPNTLFVENLRKIVNNKIEQVSLQKSKINEESSTKEKSLVEKFKTVFALRKKQFAYAFAAFLLILTLIVGSVSVYLNRTQPRSEELVDMGDVTVMADKFDSAGVFPDSTFTITTSKQIETNTLAAKIRILPETQFELSKKADNEFKLQFKSEAEPDKIYKIKVLARNSEDLTSEEGLSWAFQIRNKFRIISTLPRDKATNVPIDSSIEINFSHENFSNDFSQFIEISPKIEGRFERKAKTLVFIPQNPLKENSIYSVKVKSGLPLDSTDEKIEADYISVFETGSDRNSKINYVEFDRQSFEFKPGQKGTFIYTALQNYKDTSNISLDLYKFTNAESYSESLKKQSTQFTWSSYNQRTSVNTSGMQKITTVKPAGSYNDEVGLNIVETPQALAEGYYLAQLSTNNYNSQAFVQVTNIATYIRASNTKTIVWANDLSTGKPIEGTEIIVDDQSLAKTSADGSAFFDSNDSLKSEEKFSYVRFKTPNKKESIIKTLRSNYRYDPREFTTYGSENNDNYWSHVYIDRTAYKPNDRMSVWGFVKDRNTNNAAGDIKMKVISGNDSSIVKSQNIKTNSNGVFSAEIKIDGFNEGSYYLEVLNSKDELLKNIYFAVENYYKPIYTINATTDKKALFAGEKYIVSGDVKLFSGEGVAGLDLELTSNSGKKQFKTDSNGQFKVELIATLRNDLSGIKGYYSGTDSISISNFKPEEAEIYTYTTVKVFPSSIGIDYESDQKDPSKIKFKSYKLNLNRPYSDNDRDYIESIAKNQKLNGTLTEKYTDKVEAGEEYDPITKTVSKKYNYSLVINNLGPVNLITDNNGEVIYTVPGIKPERTYEIKVNFSDEKNRNSSILAYVWNYSDISFGNSNELNLKSKNSNSSYKLGEKESLTAEINYAIKNPANANYLFTVSGNGIREYRIGKSNVYDVIMQENDVPNFYVDAVLFDGEKYVENINSYSLNYDYSEKQIDINVSTEKQDYKPGEEVIINVDSKLKSGNPISTNINLSVVDEAFFAIYADNLNLSESLYSRINTGKTKYYISHDSYYSMGGGRGGMGGPDGELRSKFEDTASFFSIKTDSNGKAQVKFKLPDNLTTWRITYQGITDDKIPGFDQGTVNFRTSLPFFTNAVISREYLSADKPIIKLRSFGNDVKEGDQIEYTIKCTSLGLDQKVTGKVNVDSFLKLENLKAGNHKIEIRAKSGNFEDGIIRELNVIDSRTIAPITKFEKLGTNTKITTGDEGVTKLVISNENIGKYYGNTLDLYYSVGERIDQKVAKQKSIELLQKYYGENPIDYELTTSNYLIYQGGISLLPYSDSDLKISAQIADIDPTLFPKETLIRYFEKVVKDDNEDSQRVAIALYGLASLDQPVLVQINSLLASDKLDLNAKIYLALASAKLGNTQKAREILNGIISTSSEDLGNSARIKLESKNESIKSSALIARLTALTGDLKTAQKFFKYTEENILTDDLVKLETIAFLQSMLEKLPKEDVSFAYNLNGENIEKKLSKSESFTITLTKEDAEKISFTKVDGNIGISSTVMRTYNASSVQKDSTLSISKAYFVNGKQTNTVKETDLVEVRINFDIKSQANDFCYQVSDILPSGLAIVTRPYEKLRDEKAEIAYPYSIEGQRVNFCVSKQTKNKTINYYARVVSKGEYKIDSAMIRSSQNNKMNISPELGKIDIN